MGLQICAQKATTGNRRHFAGLKQIQDQLSGLAKKISNLSREGK